MDNLNILTHKIYKDIMSKEAIAREDKQSFGQCPKCKEGNINENSKAYGCSNYKEGCKFVVWKTSFGKKITENMIKELIQKNKTKKLKFKSKKTGKPYEAFLILNKEFELKLEF